MYENIIKSYIKKISVNDINSFANKNNIKLYKNEDNIIYDFIIKYWKEIYQGNTNYFEILKSKLSSQTYDTVIGLYNKYNNKRNM